MLKIQVLAFMARGGLAVNSQLQAVALFGLAGLCALQDIALGLSSHPYC